MWNSRKAAPSNPAAAEITFCLKGQHNLIPVYSHGTADEEVVVRWCPDCGAVVVDKDIDGKTFAGKIRRLQAPKIAIAVGRG